VNDAASAYKTPIGTVTVAGPILSQQFTALVNRAFNIEVGGTHLSTNNRIRFLTSSSTCGTASQAAFISQSTVTPSGGSTVTSYSGILASSIGVLKICWWDGTGTAGDASYKTLIGQLTVEGPNPGQLFTSILNAPTFVTILGSGLSTENRIRIIRQTGTCGSAVQSSSISHTSLMPSGTASRLTFAGVVVSTTHFHTVCWWDGYGTESDSADSYKVGSLLVGGPSPGQGFQAVVNAITGSPCHLYSR